MKQVYKESPIFDGYGPEVEGKSLEGELPPCVDLVTAFGDAKEKLVPSGPVTVRCARGCHLIEVQDNNFLPSGAEFKVYELDPENPISHYWVTKAL